MNPRKPLDKFSLLRYSNINGKVIPLHHAFKTIRFDAFSRVSTFTLPVLFFALVWCWLPGITLLWGHVVAFWTERIYNGYVSYETIRLLGQKLYIPYPTLTAKLPSPTYVWVNLVVSVVGFVASFLISPTKAPLTYLLRVILIIQASASIDRLISPHSFPYTIQIYVIDAFSLSLHLLFLIPIALGIIYYIFNFGFWRKALLTMLIIAYYSIFIPCQYMLHAYILNEATVIMMPALYIFFGVLLNILLFITFYSIGMSWKSNWDHGRT